MSSEYLTGSQSPVDGRAIIYVSFPIGSGKTYRLIERACEMVRHGECVIICTPTKRLANQIRSDIERRHGDVPVRVFHNDEVSHPAHGIVEYSRTEDATQPQVLIVTHQVLPHITQMERRYEWHLMIDEVLQVERCERRDRVPIAHCLLTEHLIVDEGQEMFRRIYPRSEKHMREMARQKDDEVVERHFSNPARLLSSPGWDSYVRAASYEKLRAGGGDGVLELHAILRWDVISDFKSILVVGARVEHSMMHQVWSSMGVEFVRDEEFEQTLKYRQHECGPLINIRYASGVDVSRHFLDGESVSGQSNLHALRDGAQAFMEDGRYLWSANRRVEDDFLPGTRLPNTPYGLNSYVDYHNVAILSSTNPPPGHFTFLREKLGIDGGAIKRAQVHHLAYQTVGRSSVRDPGCCERKKQFVPDCATALYLANEFPGCSVEPMECGVRAPMRRGRPKGKAPPMTAAERKRRQRERERKQAANLVMIHSDNALARGRDSFGGVDGRGVRGSARRLIRQYRRRSRNRTPCRDVCQGAGI